MENKINPIHGDSFAHDHMKPPLDGSAIIRKGTEVEARRGEFVKHFDLGRGRYQMVVYPEPVHFLEHDEWIEIDNTLSEYTDGSGREMLRNGVGPLHAEFPKVTDSGALVSLSKDGKTLSWVIRNQDHDCEAVVSGTGDESASQVLYSEVMPGLDIMYTLMGDRLKEDIILKNADAPKRVTIDLDENYYYHAEDDGHIAIEGKNGEVVPFSFAAAYAYDNQGREIPVETTLFGSHLTYSLNAIALENAEYPVTIDPMVSTSSGIQWAKFKKGATQPVLSNPMQTGVNGNNRWATALRVGNLNWDGMRRSDTVTSAFLQLKDCAGRSSNYVAAYRILCDWNRETVTWDTLGCDTIGKEDHPYIDPVMLDCKAGGRYISLDITRAYRKWKDTGKNYGILLAQPHGMSAKNYMRMKSPTLVVNYLSHAGVADWWQYEDQDVGRAGTAKVDIFNGNLVYQHDDMAMTGNRMPISVSHYYNSCLSVGGESNNPNVSNDYHCGTGFKMSVQQYVTARKAGGSWFYVWTDGTGLEHWFKKKSSGVVSKDLEGMNYKLKFHAKTSSALEKITITDSQHTVMTFKRRVNGNHAQWNNYWLVEICDSVRRTSGVYNKNTFSYVVAATPTNANAVQELEGMVQTVTDSAGRSVTFHYNSDKRLQDMEWQGELEGNSRVARKMYFDYDDEGHLTGIGYHDLQPDGSNEPEYNTRFEYQNNLLTSAANYDGKQVAIKYDYEGIEDGHACNCGCPYCCGALGDAAKVRSVEFQATAADGTILPGEMQIFEYGNLTTAVTAVESSADESGKKIVYQFNDSGNVVSMLDEMGFAQFTKFSPNTPNQPTEESKLQRVVLNSLAPFSITDAWAGENGAIIGYNKTTNTLRILGSPTAKLPAGASVAQTVTLKRGHTYTASAYANAAAHDTTAVAKMQIRVDGNIVGSETADVEMMAQENKIGLSGWARMSLTFDVPEGTDDAQVAIELLNEGTANAWVGWPQVEEGATANHVNLVYNADFTRGFTADAKDISLPSGWGKDKEYSLDENNRAVTAPTDFPSVLSGNCLKITSNPKKSKRKVYQVLGITGAKNSVFTFGGWAKALSLPGTEGKKPYFDIALSFKNKSGKYAKTVYLTFNKGQKDWQFACRAAIAPYDFTAVRLECVYSYNAEYALFSNLFLNREEFGRSFTYDDDKDVISTTDHSSQKTKIKYDSAKNIISYRKPGKGDNVVYTAKYGDTTKQREEHLPRWEKSPEGVVNRYGYDDYGNVTETKVQQSGHLGANDLCMGSANTYTLNGLFETGKTDSSGAQTQKTVDPIIGRLQSVTDPKGMIAEYTYDALDRTTGVTARPSANSSTAYRNEYVYENDEIKTVRHNTTDAETCDVEYTVEHDALGQQTDVLVGGQVLSSNKYTDNRSGLLSETQFGNGGRIRYAYDDFDRNTGVYYDDEQDPRYRYTYDAEGRLCRIEDKNLNRVAWTEYDLAGRPIRVNQMAIDASGQRELVYRSRLGYDKDSSLLEFCETAGGVNHKSVYNYDKDDRLQKMAFGDSTSTNGIQYTYDGIGRVQNIKRGSASVASSGKSVTVTDNSALKIAYQYAAGAARFGSAATTPLISKITHGVNALVYDYTYDTAGNILTVKQYNGSTAPANPTIQYTYDKLGQLIRVDDVSDATGGASGSTWIYEYDMGGNIRSKKCYPYTTGTPSGTANPDISYAYNNASWRDQLTAYGNLPMVYDEIGNLRQYNGKVFEWSAGRQLKRVKTRSNAGVNGVTAVDGYDVDSDTTLHIDFSDGDVIATANSETRAIARVFRNGKDITDEQIDAAFTWSRDSGNAAADALWAEEHAGMKEILLTADDMNGDVRITCSLTGRASLYGHVDTDTNLIASHTPSEADIDHVFSLVDGALILNVPEVTEENADANEPEIDPDENIEQINPDDDDIDDPVEESGLEPEEDIVEPEPAADTGLGNGYIEGEEEGNAESNATNETPDEVYDEVDDLPNGDASWVPKGMTYILEDGYLKVEAELNGTVTASAMVFGEEPDQAVEFSYNVDGVRVQKKVVTTNGTVTTDYILHGDQLAHVKVNDGNNTDNLHFYYDASNRPIALDYNGTKYFYVHNVHNDIAAIVDNSGDVTVQYRYNAWGELLDTTGAMAVTLGKLNPFRYRGYVYDEETGLYYLRNRYYDPELQRFINTDFDISGDLDPLSHNIYTYALNDPINRTDEDGTWSLPNWAKVAIGTALIVGAAVVATVATGGVACFAYGAAIGAAKGAISGAIGGAVTGVISNRIRTGSWKGSVQAAVNGAADGYLGGAIGGFITGGLTSKACFVAGTLVSAECGMVPIEEIHANQLVWAEDPETGERALKPVVRTFVNEKDELVHVRVNGETITCTTEHPFYVHGKGWVAAQSLVVGDKIELQSGEDAYVDAIEYEKFAVPIQVYNFEVYEFHTYYVGSACVLVHNACSQRAAMRQAKMSENIPLSQRPDRVEMVRMIGANGKSVTAKLEVYGNKYIRNDIGGHLFKDGGTMARHFNAGTVKMVGKATKYISNGKHFFY